MTRSPVRQVVFIGYRGCGKSSVGALVAKMLAVPFFDTDELIAEEAGMSIAEVFASESEAGFRRRESGVIQRVTSGGAAVISVGGGAVLAVENVTRLKAGGVIVWLTASAETLHRRISADRSSRRTRPPLTPSGGIDEIRSLLARREPVYRESADVCFSSEGRSPEQIAQDVLEWLEQGGWSNSRSE